MRQQAALHLDMTFRAMLKYYFAYRLLNALSWKPIHLLYARTQGELVMLTGRVLPLRYRIPRRDTISPKTFFYEERKPVNLWGLSYNTYNESNNPLKDVEIFPKLVVK